MPVLADHVKEDALFDSEQTDVQDLLFGKNRLVQVRVGSDKVLKRIYLKLENLEIGVPHQILSF